LDAIDVLKTKTADDTAETHTRFSFLTQPVFIWAGILIAIVSVGLMGLWHLMGEPGKTTVPLKSPQTAQIESHQPTSSDPSKVEPTSAPSPAQSILGKDGVAMFLVPGGEFEDSAEISTNQGQTVQTQPFYLDEKMVTNHHFAEFLNEVKDGLMVEKGVVKNNNEIWFYLGKGTDLHEQIIYEHGRFHLRNIDYAAHPVVRVTWYGAAAYAGHYGKRLLTKNEWDYVVSKIDFRSKILSASKTYNVKSNIEEISARNEIHSHMMDFRDDIKDGTGSSEIEKGNNIMEWIKSGNTIRQGHNEDQAKQNFLYDSLVTGNFSHSNSESTKFRYPWEAFSNVGFRCALSLGNKY
jgi:hypothetical protein